MPNDPDILETPRGTKYRRLLVKLNQPETPAVTTEKHNADSEGFQRVKLSLRDWILICVFLVANTGGVVLWLDQRFHAVETSNSLQDSRIDELRVARGETNTKLDTINSTLTSLSVKIAEIAGQRRP